MDDLERCLAFSFMDAEPFEHYNRFINESYRMNSRRLPTKMHDICDSMSSTHESMQTLRSDVHESVAGASVLKKIICLEDDKAYSLRDRASLFCERVQKS